MNATARIIVLALVLDAIYQVLVLKTLYPFEALVVALLLAYIPYLIIRLLVVRVWRRPCIRACGAMKALSWAPAGVP